jgi:cytochrome c oxidase subunit 4
MHPTEISGAPPGGEKPLAHVVEARVLLTVFAVLVVLTAITVAVSYFNFGPLNLIVALGIATVKAALVALWFMHLRYESGLHAFIFLVGVAFLGLFLIIAMFDAVQYQPNIQAFEQSQQ